MTAAVKPKPRLKGVAAIAQTSGFKAELFARAKLTPRTAVVPVPSMAAWFEDGAAAEWHVRGLSASELCHAMDAGKRQGDIGALLKAVSAGGDMVQALRKALGLSHDTPGEVVKRLEMLVMGSIAPTTIDLPNAVKLGEAFAIDFYAITNTITELTGKGSSVGEPQAVSPPIPA